ncbi:MAG: RNA polymerase sigma factor [Lachnospiraceae bacterium]|nr:RNA polymerase sigma factor [Lachnospiraceae bacterium]
MADGADGYRRFLGGDWNGLKEVTEEYYRGLVLYLNRYLNNMHDAEDMAEETFYTLAVKRPKYTPKAEFKTWLYRVGRNVTLKHLRKSRREILFTPEDMSGYMQSGEGNLSELIREEEAGMLRSAMQRLTEDHRQVLLLKYFEEMSAEEIGTVMNKSKHSVNGLLKRAKAALRQELKKEGYRHERS